jgi:hypothetical protein
MGFVGCFGGFGLIYSLLILCLYLFRFFDLGRVLELGIDQNDRARARAQSVVYP